MLQCRVIYRPHSSVLLNYYPTEVAMGPYDRPVIVISIITSAEEGGICFWCGLLVCLSVCLSLRRITRKLVNGF